MSLGDWPRWSCGVETLHDLFLFELRSLAKSSHLSVDQLAICVFPVYLLETGATETPFD